MLLLYPTEADLATNFFDVLLVLLLYPELSVHDLLLFQLWMQMVGIYQHGGTAYCDKVKSADLIDNLH